MIVLDSCCFCIPLRVGCLILGYIHLVADIILVILTLLALLAGIVVSESSTDDQGAGTIVIAISVVTLIFVAILLTFTIVLLVGLHKEKRGHVKAYLIYALIFLIIYVVLFIVTCSMGGASVGYIIETIIEILLDVYFLIVFRSHYVKMGEVSRNTV